MKIIYITLIMLTCSASLTYSDMVTVAHKELLAPHPLKKSFWKYELIQENMIEMVSERVVIRPPETSLERDIAAGHDLAEASHFNELLTKSENWFKKKPAPELEHALKEYSNPYNLSYIRGQFIADCLFEMKSHADYPIKSHIGFPISGNNYGYGYEMGFDVFVDGVQLPVKIKCDTDDSGDYEGFYIWEMEWQPHETKTVRCIFGTALGGKQVPLCRSQTLIYIVKTGNYWRGPIGQATIIMDLGINCNKWVKYKSTLEHEKRVIRKFKYNYPENAQWIDDHTLEWNFKNWSPTNDVSVSWMAWNPQTNLAWTASTPFEYVGYATNYSEGLFEDFIDADMKVAREYFPELIQPSHRKRVKRYHANWLRNQILYAHNVDNEQSEPARRLKSITIFDYYRYPYPKKRSLWPDPEKPLEAALRELNDIEQVNYAFLLEVLSETTE